MSRMLCALCAATAATAASSDFAQSQPINLPTITVQGSRPAIVVQVGSPAAGTSLTVPNTAQATAEIDQTPGAVAVVPDTAFRDTPAQTIKDIVDYVPGVWAQPKWGDDARLSIRGSGLSRNFHLRGVQLYMDGIPINTSDGYGDFQEIDPIAYRYVEVFKGGNALRFGANSLGGAINFVTPSGRDAQAFDGRVDAGSFGYWRGAAAVGGVYGAADYFLTGSAQQAEGFRDHSDGEAQRASANIGYQFSPMFETRLYVNGNSVRQSIPGELTKEVALTSPKTAWTDNVVNDWQRNIDTGRIASKSTLKLDNTTIDFGVFGVDRHLMHPIYQWLDYHYNDYGGFVRSVDERMLGGYRNRFTAGLNILNGTIDADQYENIGGNKGALLSSRVQRPENYAFYAENAFYVLPNVSLVAGMQYLYAVRDQEVNFSDNGDVDGRSTFNLWSPKGGFVWDVDPTWQVFGNVSRSAEAPSFGEGGGASAIDFTQIKAQTATTYEIGTRGRRPDYTWDLAVYRADIQNELQCLVSDPFGNCNVTNADKTLHQGVEVGIRPQSVQGTDGVRQRSRQDLAQRRLHL